jgi:RNA polymerase sigma factor (sigma-70 family)
MEDPTGYVYRVAFNLFRKRLRRARLSGQGFGEPGMEPDPFAAVEARHLVAQGLAGLTPRQRAALVLTELMELSSESAARLLGVRPSTVRSLATQGRSVLRRTLGERK